jgi:hypothetical protein
LTIYGLETGLAFSGLYSAMAMQPVVDARIKAAGMRMVFGILARLLLSTVLLTFMVPDTARARRRSRLTSEPAAAQGVR